MDFELPTERGLEQNRDVNDRDLGRRNLMEVEDRIHLRMNRLAKEVGGRYIPPTVPEIVHKVNTTLDINSNVFYSVDKDERIWSPGGKRGQGAKNVEAYNRSGSFGFILMDSADRKEGEEESLRLYRGCIYDPKVRQIAPLARAEGLSVQDIYDYVDNKTSMDKIISKVRNKETKRYLQYSLASYRRQAEENSTTEMDEIKRMHTQYTSGAIDIDLWVSAAFGPGDTYRSQSMGNVYGDFFSDQGIRSVLILDVPRSKVEDYKSEAGILAEIKPEYIRAIVPVSGNIRPVVERAETYIKDGGTKKW